MHDSLTRFLLIRCCNGLTQVFVNEFPGRFQCDTLLETADSLRPFRQHVIDIDRVYLHYLFRGFPDCNISVQREIQSWIQEKWLQRCEWYPQRPQEPTPESQAGREDSLDVEGEHSLDVVPFTLKMFLYPGEFFSQDTPDSD